ncbi:MAG: arylsulfatase [Planctomycetota bacterium]|nr:arylsulfatase [Planctomycetota bacterium]
MTTFQLRGLLVCACLVWPTQVFSAEPSSKAARPNIVIVLVDDMGFSDIGCYGGEIETPNLDRMAAGGLRFTQFYNAGRCCPTRASLMTGLHPHQVGIGHMTEPPERRLGFDGAYQGHLNDNCTTIAEVLKAADYHTLMVGKWHLGYHEQADWPTNRGFDKFLGGISGAFNYFKPEGSRGLTNGTEPYEAGDDFYATDTFTDIACDYISKATKADDKPFFLYLAFNAPHWPLNTKMAEFKKYKGKYREGWNALMNTRLAKQQAMGMFAEDITPAPHVGRSWDKLSDEKKDEMDSIQAAYAGCIDSIDQNMGKLTEHLKSLGKLDNTVIFFLSDNGACQEGGDLGQFKEEWLENPPAGTAGIRQGLAWANASNTPFRLYKHFVHEGGACTPMIAHWPAGIPKASNGQFVRQFAYLPDFMATCVELAGAQYPSDIPACVGNSFVANLSGRDAVIHDAPIYWEHEGNAAMRWGDWKLVKEWKKPWELYNIAKDRTEMENLVDFEAAQFKKMLAMWESWAKKHEVAYPERFNMYQHLNQLKKAEKEKEKKRKLQPVDDSDK